MPQYATITMFVDDFTGKVLMAVEQRCIPIEVELLQEAQERVSPEGFTQFMNDALRYYLQALRIREVEAELAAEFGPIPDEMQNAVLALRWTE